MTPSETSRLGYALLGLLHQQPASGYDIRRIFTDTPMGAFSNSPGAIYPALRRLEAGGLIQGRVENRSGLRRRQVFRLTPAGTRALRRWLTRPVAHEDVVSGLEELMLRFAFLDDVIGGTAAVTFLEALQRGLDAYIPGLRQHLAAHRAEMSRSGGLALESGIRSYESLLEWSKHAIRAYEGKSRGGRKP
jgi:DNA-binding PadR family transcriptional regulator